MKTKIGAIGGACAAALALATSSQAVTFDLTFTDFNSVVQGYGAINASPNGDGSYTVTSGYWDVIAGPEAGLDATILGNPTSPLTILSPSGYFAYDSQLYPHGAELVDYWGLLFGTGTTPSEVNVFADSPTQYEEYFNNGVDILGTLTVQQIESAIPRPPTPVSDASTTSTLLGAMTLGLTGLRRRVGK